MSALQKLVTRVQDRAGENLLACDNALWLLRRLSSGAPWERGLRHRLAAPIKGWFQVKLKWSSEPWRGTSGRVTVPRGMFWADSLLTPRRCGWICKGRAAGTSPLVTVCVRWGQPGDPVTDLGQSHSCCSVEGRCGPWCKELTSRHTCVEEAFCCNLHPSINLSFSIQLGQWMIHCFTTHSCQLI